MAFRICSQLASGAVDCRFFTDASEHVGKRSAIRMMIEHIIDGYERHLGVARDFLDMSEVGPVASAIEHRGGKANAARRGATQMVEKSAVAAHGDQLQT